jgi:pyruvate formate lyase activating enzyme
MNIGGFQKTSLLDYPDTLSSIVWTTGCNFRCPFCYNRDIVLKKVPVIPEKEVLSHLQKRKKVLEGVVISGGEPFLQADLREFLMKVKDLGYLVKIDTNGMFPNRLRGVLEDGLVDYVSMDIKAPKEKYNELAGVSVDLKKIEASIKLIRSQAKAYEFKTTVVPDLLNMDDVVQIGQWLEGSEVYYLQQFKPISSLISSEFLSKTPYSPEYLYEALDKVKPFFSRCFVRGV